MTLTVAVVGGGISGICAARSCLKEGLIPTLFEATSEVGGHWSSSESDVTGIFDNLFTNIPFYETTTTDVFPLRDGPNPEHGPYASCFLNKNEWNQYIHHLIAISPGLADCFRLSSRVISVRRVGTRYNVCVEQHGVTSTTEFDRVVVATGPMQKPRLPPVTNLKYFRGRVLHSKAYRNPNQFEGQSVLVVGGSISGPECAGDMADTPTGEGPSSVLLLMRSMKHFVVKQRNERSYTFLQYNNLSSLRLRAGVANLMEEHVRLHPKFDEEFSSNADWGLPPYKKGNVIFPISHKFLQAAKSGEKLTHRIGEIAEVLEDGGVKFNDGDVQYFDVILFGTGYDLELPIFEKEISDVLIASDEERFHGLPEMNLYGETWHHELPGCAFVGLYAMIAPAFVMVDMQSRWVARAFADEKIMPDAEEVHEGVKESIARRKRPGYVPLRFVSPLLYEFAEKVGCEIDYAAIPELSKSLLVGPFVPAQFRLFGYGAVEDPVALYQQAIRLAGANVEDVQVRLEDILMLKECLEAFKKKGRVPLGLAESIQSLEEGIKSS